MSDYAIRRATNTLILVSRAMPALKPGFVAHIDPSQAALKTIETKWRGLVENIDLGIVVYDVNGAVVEANKRALQVAALAHDELASLNTSGPFWLKSRRDGSPLPPDERPPATALHAGCCVFNVELDMTSSDGEERWIRVSAMPVTDSDTGAIRGAVTSLEDITERKRAEDTLRVRERQVDTLVKTCITGQEERERVILGVQQILAQTAWAAASCLEAANSWAELPGPVRGILARAAGLLDASLVDSRALISGVRPTILDILGLAAALRSEFESRAAAAGLRIELECTERPLPKVVETALYRIASEAVDNVIRHARATHAWIRVKTEGRRAVAEVEDDGAGFDLNQWQKRLPPSGLGLRTVRKRIELLDGDLTVRSSPNEGTCLRATLPLPGDGNDWELTLPSEPRSHPDQQPIDHQGVTVLIVDDHVVTRRGLRALLEADETLTVVGEAADGQEALHRVAELHPHIVLMDVSMPVMDGVEATRRIKAEYPSTGVVLLSTFDDEALVVNAIRVGAGGYLLKGSPWELVRQAIGTALSGGVLLDAGLLRQTVDGLARIRRGREDLAIQAKPEIAYALTDRELAVLRHVSEGLTNKQIGEAFGYAEITVKKMVQAVINKLGASDRTHAAIMALRLGLID